MKHTFENSTPVGIDSGSPSSVQSALLVSGVAGSIANVTVAFDIDHTYTSDLEVRLESPAGQSVRLVAASGGSGDHFRNTEFDDASTSVVSQASAPFSGTFRPEESLAAFMDQEPNGTWLLHVEDRAWFDGGSLNRWSLSISTDEEPSSGFAIEVRFEGGLSSSQQQVFESAAARWAQVITGSLSPVQTDIGVVNNLVIDAKGEFIDGEGAVLGQAGPTALRASSLLPARGVMAFDSADLDRMEADGRLVKVIEHEMGHVLGVGTLWQRKGVLQGAGTANPLFLGAGAMREFSELSGALSPEPVPVANTGGAGTADGHWRESVFGSELMTGFLSGGTNPLSRMSIASLGDLGYEVNLSVADDYVLPSSLELAAMGVGADAGHAHDTCTISVPVPSVYPAEAENL